MARTNRLRPIRCSISPALPRFGEIAPGHVEPAIDALLERCPGDRRAGRDDRRRANLGRISSSPLAAAQDRLDRAWGQVTHLNAVVNTPALREAYNASLPKVTALHTDIGQDVRLFAGFRALCSGPDFGHLEPGQRRLIENDLRDFRLAGAELTAPAKARFKEIEEELAGLAARFEDNVLDATNDYALYIEDRADLAGVPADVLAAAREAAMQDGRSGWKLTLRMPCYQPLLQYADKRAIRETLYRAFAVRASEFGRCGVGQYAADRPDSRVAPGSSAPARLSQLCGSFAGREDGAHARPGSRVPARPRRPGAAVR